MYELGDQTNKEHQAMVDMVRSMYFDKVLLVGQYFYDIQIDSKNIFQFKSFEELRDKVSFEKIKDTNILIKGSRSLALERILNLL